jgi:hypothetical protein
MIVHHDRCIAVSAFADPKAPGAQHEQGRGLVLRLNCSGDPPNLTYLPVIVIIGYLRPSCSLPRRIKHAMGGGEGWRSPYSLSHLIRPIHRFSAPASISRLTAIGTLSSRTEVLPFDCSSMARRRNAVGPLPSTIEMEFVI